MSAVNEPIAVTLCRATNMWPRLSETEKSFMDRMLERFDDLSEEQYNQVPEDARTWAQGAIEALVDDNPVEPCPGFDDVFDVEDHTPLFADEDASDEESDDEDSEASGEEEATDTEEEPTPVAAKGRGRGKNKVERKASDGKKVARGAKAKTAKAPRKVREMGDGKTTKIMEEIYHNPKATVSQIIDALAAKGVECTVPSTTVVRSFFRHTVKFLASRGVLSEKIDL